MNLGVAYQNFFRKLKDPRIPSSEKGFPKFKKKNAKKLFQDNIGWRKPQDRLQKE